MTGVKTFKIGPADDQWRIQLFWPETGIKAPFGHTGVDCHIQMNTAIRFAHYSHGPFFESPITSASYWSFGITVLGFGAGIDRAVRTRKPA